MGEVYLYHSRERSMVAPGLDYTGLTTGGNTQRLFSAGGV